jgi:hypothetical protein
MLKRRIWDFVSVISLTIITGHISDLNMQLMLIFSINKDGIFYLLG